MAGDGGGVVATLDLSAVLVVGAVGCAAALLALIVQQEADVACSRGVRVKLVVVAANRVGKASGLGGVGIDPGDDLRPGRVAVVVGRVLLPDARWSTVRGMEVDDEARRGR